MLIKIKKKEIETLKKQLIVQDTNKFGDVITLNKNNIFKNVKTNVNPFRFPNKIKTEELQQNDDILTVNNDLKDEKSPLNNNDELSSYKKKLLEYNKYIFDNELTIENIQKEYNEKINQLKIEYENKILEQKNKYDKWKLIVSGLTELINDFNNNNSNNTTDYSKIEIKNQNNTEEEIKVINETEKTEENIVFNINEPNNLNRIKNNR